MIPLIVVSVAGCVGLACVLAWWVGEGKGGAMIPATEVILDYPVETLALGMAACFGFVWWWCGGWGGKPMKFMKAQGLWYELRCAMVADLFHLILWIVPARTVFGTVVAEGLGALTKRLIALEAAGWMSGRPE